MLTRRDFEPLKTVGKGQWGKVFLVRKCSGPVAGRAAADPGLVAAGANDRNVSPRVQTVKPSTHDQVHELVLSLCTVFCQLESILHVRSHHL